MTEEIWLELLKLGGAILAGGGLLHGGQRIYRSRQPLTETAALEAPASRPPDARTTEEYSPIVTRALCGEFRADLKSDLAVVVEAHTKACDSRHADTQRQIRSIQETSQQTRDLVQNLDGFLRGQGSRQA